METVQAKQLLTPLTPTDDFFYSNYNLNLYRGCSHGCIYCDSRSECYRLDRFDDVRVKENALSLLREELQHKKKPGMVSTGAMSDPYNPYEKELEVTRGALRLLRQYGFGVGFTTKSALAARDGDLLLQIQNAAPVRACFSITAADDTLSHKIEPNVSPSSQRFGALSSLAQKGIFAGVWLNPMLPFITDTEDNIRSLVRMTKENGGQFIVCHFGMTLRTGNREYFYQALDRDFPGLKDEYAKAYGLKYVVTSPRAEALYALFKEECVHHGLYYRFSDINRVLLEKQPQQMCML